MIIIFVRTILIYISLLIAFRIMGKAELSKVSTFQMVVLFMIAELAAMPIDSPSASIVNGIAAIFTLLFLEVLFSLCKKQQMETADQRTTVCTHR